MGNEVLATLLSKAEVDEIFGYSLSFHSFPGSRCGHIVDAHLSRKCLLRGLVTMCTLALLTYGYTCRLLRTVPSVLQSGVVFHFTFSWGHLVYAPHLTPTPAFLVCHLLPRMRNILCCCNFAPVKGENPVVFTLVLV